MRSFLSDNISKTNKDRKNIKNQFGGATAIDEYAILKIENFVIKSSNLKVTVDGVETVKRRWDWINTTDFKKGTITRNMRNDKNILQVG